MDFPSYPLDNGVAFLPAQVVHLTKKSNNRSIEFGIVLNDENCEDMMMTEKILVRPILNEQDYASSLAIRRSVFVKEQGVPEELEIDHEKESHHFLALYEQLPAATGRYRLKKGFTKFERIATLKPFRGKGIARVLMQSMQSDCLKRYPEYLPMMHAQISVISFYLKLGWIALGNIFQEANIDHQLMILPPEDPSSLKCLADPETAQSIRTFFEQKI